MGLQENGVFLAKSIEEVENFAEKLFLEGKESVSICPYYDIKTEYRCFYLDGKVLLIYGKEKPYVIGNGIDTIENICEKENKPIDYSKENIVDYKYIPKKDEKVYISWKHNLAGGAVPKILEKGDLYNNIEDLALKAANAINIRFATVDIIRTAHDKLFVIEINSRVCAERFSQQVENGYDISKEIYRKALKLLFD